LEPLRARAGDVMSRELCQYCVGSGEVDFVPCPVCSDGFEPIPVSAKPNGDPVKLAKAAILKVFPNFYVRSL